MSSPSPSPSRRKSSHHYGVNSGERAPDGLDPSAIIPAGSADYPCPMCPDMKPFDSQRALTKHLTMHQRAFDEEEVRTGKGAPKLTGSTSTSSASKKGQRPHSLLDLLSQSGGAVPSNKSRKKDPSRKKQVVRRGSDEDEGMMDETGEESEEWEAEPVVTASKKKKSKKKAVEEDISLSDEERRQTALRKEQKRINQALSAAGATARNNGPVPEEEEEVRCCLCHQADSDETNPIVMCDGPCDLPFHQQCQGIDHIPKGKWFCSTACKAGRRIDRVEHLAAHRIRYQRRRRMMSNQHNAREQSMLNEFWRGVEPYFDSRFLTEYGQELLEKTELTHQLFSVPDLGRSYKEIWREEDERKQSARSGRVNRTDPNSTAAAATAATSTTASPAPSPLPSPTTSSDPSPEELTAEGADYFAAEGRERLYKYLQTLDSKTSPSELTEMERIASKPHTAAVSILAYVASTAPPKIEIEPDEIIIDPDVRPAFDRPSYYFPTTQHHGWTPPEGVLKRQESHDDELDRAISLEEAAEQMFAQSTSVPNRYLTGAHKDKKVKEKEKVKENEKSHATKPNTNNNIIRLPLSATTTNQPKESPKPKPTPASPPAASTATSASSSGRSSPQPMDTTTTETETDLSSSSSSMKFSLAKLLFGGSKFNESEKEEKSYVKKEPTPPPTKVKLEEQKTETKEEDDEEDEDQDADMSDVEEEKKSSDRKTKGAKQPRAKSDSTTTAVRSTSNKAPKSSDDATTTAHTSVGSKAPRQPGQGIKAPRKKDADGTKKKKSQESSKKKKASDDDMDEEDENDENESDSNSEDDEDDDDDSMTLSEEEDMRAEQEDAAALAAESSSSTAGGGQGHGKTQGKTPAGKGQRGGSGPATSDRVFSMAPRRNDDVAAEEIELEPIEEVEMVATLPAPYFDFRSVDFSSLKDMGLRLPKPRIMKLQHQAIVENFPFVGVVHPSLLAASCHYSFPPLLYNMHTMQLIDMNMRPTGTGEEEKTSEEAPVEEGKDTLETLGTLQSKLSALNASLEIVEVSRQQNLLDIIPPPSSTVTLELLDDDGKVKEEIEAVKVEKEEKDDQFGAKFSTTSSSRRERATARNATSATAATPSPTASPTADISVSSTAASSSTSSSSLVLPLTSTASDFASLSISPGYDDEVSAELWLAQRQLLIQANHNNYTRDYLTTRAQASGSWKTSLEQIEQKEKQDKDTLNLYEESFLLSMARQQRESRRAKLALSEAGQIRHIKRWERMEQRNQRHIQRLMKSMVVEVERREKRRLLNERRDHSAQQREAKRLRRQAQEAQWKNRRDLENYRRCENALDHIIKQIERQVEGKVSKPRKPRDPNAKPRTKKKKDDGEDPNALYCICRTPYDNDRFYLGCENCLGWFHGKCVGFTEEQAGGIEYYICPDCEKKTGRITTFLDTKRDRASRRMKLKSTDSDEDDMSDVSSDEDSTESDEGEQEYIRPIVIRKEKKRGKWIFKVVEHESEEEEEEENDSDAESEASDEVTDMELVTSDEEEESEEVNPIQLRRFSTHTLRLRQLEDAPEPDTKTRAKANLARYEVAGISAWSAFAVTSDDHDVHHEQHARRMLRRFRHRRNFYPTDITEALVKKYAITPSLAPGQKSRHKFSAYAYRYHSFKIVRFNKETLTLTIRKTEDSSRTKPNDIIVLPTPSRSTNPAASTTATPVAPSAPKPPRPLTVKKVVATPQTVMIDCPICQKPCADEIGIARHYVRAHQDVPRPNATESAELRAAQIAKNKLKSSQPSTDTAAISSTSTATPTSDSKLSGKRKREPSDGAGDAIKTLAVIATSSELVAPTATDEMEVEPATPKSTKLRLPGRRTPSPVPQRISPIPISIAALTAAAETVEDQDVEMTDATPTDSTTPTSGGRFRIRRTDGKNHSLTISPARTLTALTKAVNATERGRTSPSPSPNQPPSPATPNNNSTQPNNKIRLPLISMKNGPPNGHRSTTSAAASTTAHTTPDPLSPTAVSSGRDSRSKRKRVDDDLNGDVDGAANESPMTPSDANTDTTASAQASKKQRRQSTPLPPVPTFPNKSPPPSATTNHTSPTPTKRSTPSPLPPSSSSMDSSSTSAGRTSPLVFDQVDLVKMRERKTVQKFVP